MLPPSLLTAVMAQAPSSLGVYYGQWDRSTDNIPDYCPYQLADLGLTVPDECCTRAPTVQAALDFSTGPTASPSRSPAQRGNSFATTSTATTGSPR